MADPTTPVLVACAHGTRSPVGRRLVGELVARVRAARPGLPVRAAFVDVQHPEPGRVLERLGSAEGVVVPLLLSAGFHVHVDLRRAVEQAQAAGVRVRAAGALGPDGALVAVLAERLAAATAGGRTPDHVVLAAAGSSDRRAVADVERTASALAGAFGVPVSTGYLSAAAPTVPDAVTAARAGGAGQVAVASYLLAPGFFADRLQRAGADLVSAPLLPHPALADLVLRRYDEAAAG